MSEKDKKKLNQSLSTSISVGFFLAFRQIKNASIWATGLIIFIMVLTFLNLVVASGLLVGSIEGTTLTVQERYLGDLFVSTLKNKAYIERTTGIVNTARGLEGVEAVTARYLEGGTIEADYKESRKPSDLDESVATTFAGIDPADEDAVTGLSDLVIEGDYLEDGDFDKILLGGMLIERLSSFESAGFPVLEDAQVGDKLLVEIGDTSREVTVKGIIKSKIDELDRRVFFTDTQLKQMIDRFDNNAVEIAMRLDDGTNPVVVKESLLASGFGKYARIETPEEAEPKFVKDLRTTFGILGNIISSIGLVVTAITMFIVIFINAITRRKFIGILKGIGINAQAIEISYIFQSVFYALAGSAVGLLLTYGALVPYFAANKIDFPFGDGILVAPLEGTLLRVFILVVSTIVAGYIPARMIIKRNTLDAILGR